MKLTYSDFGAYAPRPRLCSSTGPYELYQQGISDRSERGELLSKFHFCKALSSVIVFKQEFAALKLSSMKQERPSVVRTF